MGKMPRHKPGVSLMSKRPPTKLEQAIGKDDPFELAAFHHEMRKIEASWREVVAPNQPTVAVTREQLRRTAATHAKARKEWIKNPRFYRREIFLAGFIRANPDVEESKLRAVAYDGFADFDAKMSSDSTEQDIKLVMQRLDDYRKEAVRKWVIEPFCKLLEKTGIVPSPRKLPFTKMMTAAFDEIGVDVKYRPSPGSINVIRHHLRYPTKPPKLKKKPQWPKRTKRR